MNSTELKYNSNASNTFNCLVSSPWTHRGDICFDRQTTRAVSRDQRVPKLSGGSRQNWHLNKVLLQTEMKKFRLRKGVFASLIYSKTGRSSNPGPLCMTFAHWSHNSKCTSPYLNYLRACERLLDWRTGWPLELLSIWGEGQNGCCTAKRNPTSRLKHERTQMSGFCQTSF